MTQSTPTFEDQPAETNGNGENELDLEVNDDANLDVDTPSAEDETEVVAEDATGEKATKPTSTPRTKAPEGYVKPVEFAKILSEHLNKTVPPQVVYSYLKNNGKDSKNPFPLHEIEGYAMYIKKDEGLAWWDAKNTRVATAKASKAEKAAKKAAEPAASGEAAEPSSGEVTEAE
jgi:hypothetical protein